MTENFLSPSKVVNDFLEIYSNYNTHRDFIEECEKKFTTPDEKSIVKVLSRDKRYHSVRNSFIRFVERGPPKIVEAYLKENPDLSKQIADNYNWFNQNPLLCLSQFPVEIAEILIKYGANVDDGCPLSKYSEQGKIELVDVLLKHGANANGSDNYHPLWVCSDLEIAHFLVKYGAKANGRGKNGRCALHYARSAKMAKYLIELGAPVDAVDEWGMTPFEYHSTYYGGDAPNKDILNVLDHK